MQEENTTTGLDVGKKTKRSATMWALTRKLTSGEAILMYQSTSCLLRVQEGIPLLFSMAQYPSARRVSLISLLAPEEPGISHTLASILGAMGPCLNLANSVLLR